LQIVPLDEVLRQEKTLRALQSEFKRKHAVQIRKRLFLVALNKGLQSQHS